jgi:hypothetical protein
VHGPGTALGLKLLRDNDAFKGHSYGGVYEVKVDRFADYFEKIQQSHARWETPSYAENRFDRQDFDVDTVRVFLSSPARKDDEYQKQFNHRLQSLLAEIYKDIGRVLEIKEPYSLALGADIDFWDSIFDYHKACHFIVHDLTNCAHGVMVEIGYSIGSRKQHFLIWNAKKALFEVWKRSKKPALLHAENVDVIDDVEDSSAARNVLENKLVKRAQARLHSPNCSHCLEACKIENRRAAFLYCQHQNLAAYLEGQMESHGIYRLVAEDTKAEARICQTCQALRLADFAIIEISESDLDGFILLGMTKAIGLKTLLLSLDKYESLAFPWAQEIVPYHMDRMAERLAAPVSKFINH